MEIDTSDLLVRFLQRSSIAGLLRTEQGRTGRMTTPDANMDRWQQAWYNWGSMSVPFEEGNRRTIMEFAERRYSKEEFSRRGDAIYENDIRPQLSTDDDGKFAAIDIESGTYEIDVDELAACDRLRARVPDAQIWIVRIGSRYVHRLRAQFA